MTSSVTLRDVANAAGVHVSTASRALNPATRSIVSATTATKVLAAAKRLGYRPHPIARGLRTNRTLTVGMVIPDLMNPLFPPIYSGAEATLGAVGYALLIAENKDKPDDENRTIEALLERRVDGLIVASSRLDSSPPPLLQQLGIPTVLVNRSTSSRVFPAIVGDDYVGIGLIVKHLVSLGHRSIGHVAGPPHLSTGLGRREAFVAWMNSEGLEIRMSQIVEAESFRTDAGRAACRRLLKARPDLTAIVAANDLIALGCFDDLAERGLSLPAEMSVTGYNDMTFIDRVTPALTSVRVPYVEMGAAAARVLLGLIGSQEAEGVEVPHLVMLSPSLVVRSSTSHPRP